MICFPDKPLHYVINNILNITTENKILFKTIQLS